MHRTYLCPSRWEHGNSYVEYDIVTDGRFDYIAKNDIEGEKI